MHYIVVQLRKKFMKLQIGSACQADSALSFLHTRWTNGFEESWHASFRECDTSCLHK